MAIPSPALTFGRLRSWIRSVGTSTLAALLLAAPSTAYTGDGAALRPEVQAYQTTMPLSDPETDRLLAEHPGEPMHCTVVALVDEYGGVREVFPQGCPRALRDSASMAVKSWQFHPPVVGGRAVSGRTTVELIYVRNSVVVSTPVPDGAWLVRLGPTAYPLWPSPPKLSRSGRQFLEEQEAKGYHCKVAFEVDSMGLPEKVLVQDCPAALHERVLRRAYRFGFRVENAVPGDGTVYHMDLWVAAEG